MSGGASWSAARRAVAGMAILTATLTGAGVATLGGLVDHLYGAMAYVAVTGIALFVPVAVIVQVVGGLVLVGSLVTVPGVRIDALTLLPVVAGWVASAELLGVVARMDLPFPRDPRDDLRRAGVAVVIAGAVYGVVALAGAVAGPGGLMAVALASGACVAVAVVLVRQAQA